jgi:hypothetical protein
MRDEGWRRVRGQSGQLAALLLLVPGGCHEEVPETPCEDCDFLELAVNETCRAVSPPPELAEVVAAYPLLPEAQEPIAVVRNGDGRHAFLLERKGVIHRFEELVDAWISELRSCP